MELTKFHTLLGPAHKDVLVAYYMKLAEHDVVCRAYRQQMARKLADEVVADPRATLAIRLLSKARLGQMMFIPLSERDQHSKQVGRRLKIILQNPDKIADLEQDWKTFVHLAQMTCYWRAMFYGLSKNRSPDLHLKSYFWFLLKVWNY